MMFSASESESTSRAPSATSMRSSRPPMSATTSTPLLRPSSPTPQSVATLRENSSMSSPWVSFTVSTAARMYSFSVFLSPISRLRSASSCVVSRSAWSWTAPSTGRGGTSRAWAGSAEPTTREAPSAAVSSTRLAGDRAVVDVVTGSSRVGVRRGAPLRAVQATCASCHGPHRKVPRRGAQRTRPRAGPLVQGTGPREPAVRRRGRQLRVPGTTITGESASASTAWETEPMSRPRKPP